MKKVFIVDDDSLCIKIISRAIKNNDLVIESTTDADDSIDKIKAFKPDLIIIDLIMPKISGFELAKKIRGDRLINHIPIIFVSNSDPDGLNKNPVKFNGDDFVNKGDDNFYIKDKVNHYSTIGQLNNVIAKMNHDTT